MLPTTISQSNQLSLNEVIARLELHDAVDGILLNQEQSAVNFAPGSAFELGMIERGLAFWESLVAGSPIIGN